MNRDPDPPTVPIIQSPPIKTVVVTGDVCLVWEEGSDSYRRCRCEPGAPCGIALVHCSRLCSN